MAQITGGELLARCLANEGVKIVFGLPCPEIDPFLAALEGNGIRLVPIRHEAAAVHMAEGLYKTTGQVAAVLGNPGPGSGNLLPGVLTARHEGVPVIVITSQHRMGLVYPSSPATFQGQDQLDMFRPLVKWGAPLFEWTRIPEVVRMAFREMWTGRPGPVHLEVPAPNMYATGEDSEADLLPPESYRASQPQPSEAQLEAAADLLADAQKPVVIAGSGVDRGGANEALLSIVERLDCPVVSSLAARSAVPLDHPNYFHPMSPAADAVRSGADVMLVAGSRLGNLDVPFDKYWGDPAGCKIIQIDIDPRNMGVTRPIALGLVAEVNTALDGLRQKLEGRDCASPGAVGWQDQREEFVAWSQALVEQATGWSGGGIHPVQACGVVGAVFGPEAVYVADGGMTSLWASLGLPPTRPSSYHSIFELGMLGTGIPSAIGAKIGAPSREVVCVTGDGAAGFNFMEMQSAARENTRLTVVVMAEGAWTMEVPNEMSIWGKTFGTHTGEVRWDKVAEGLGCHAEYVTELDQLGEALGRAGRHDGPSVVCVRTSAEANLALPEFLWNRFFEVYQGPSA